MKLHRSVYVITGSKLLHRDDAGADPCLKDPASVSKRVFRLALQDSIANPVYEHVRGGRPPARTPELDLYIGAKEVSQVESEDEHHHVVLKFSFHLASKTTSQDSTLPFL